ARSCAQTPEPTRGFLGEGGEESLTARFDSGESQLHCRPRAGPLLPGEQSQTQRVTRRLAKKPGALNVASLEYLVVPAEAGIQAKPRPALREYSCTPPRSRRLPLRERGDERTAGGCGERVARETHVGDLERQRTTTQRLLEAITKPVRFRRAARENDRQR